MREMMKKMKGSGMMKLMKRLGGMKACPRCQVYRSRQ